MIFKNYVWINREAKEVFDIVTSRTTICYTHFINGKGQRVANANIRLYCSKEGVSIKTGEQFGRTS